jgi:hypothetical protein
MYGNDPHPAGACECNARAGCSESGKGTFTTFAFGLFAIFVCKLTELDSSGALFFWGAGKFFPSFPAFCFRLFLKDPKP